VLFRLTLWDECVCVCVCVPAVCWDCRCRAELLEISELGKHGKGLEGAFDVAGFNDARSWELGMTK